MPHYASIQTTSSHSKSQGCSISVNHIACSSLWDYPEDISDHPREFMFHKGRGKENMIHATRQSWHCQTQLTGGACTDFCVHMKHCFSLQQEFKNSNMKWLSVFSSLAGISCEHCTSPAETFRLEKTFNIIEPNRNARYKDFYTPNHFQVVWGRQECEQTSFGKFRILFWPSVCINK